MTEASGLSLGYGVILTLGVVDTGGVPLGVTLIEGVTVGVVLGVKLIDGDMLILGVTVGVTLILGVTVGVTEGLGVADGGSKLLVTENTPHVSLFVIVIEVAEYGMSNTIPIAKSSTLYPLPNRFVLS